MRTLIGVLIAAALLLGVLIFWFLPADDGTPSTEAGATSTTTVPTTEPSTSVTTTTTPPSTTTSTPADDSHVVESVEEAEEILRELWFGWFEGIYNQDEDRIREVVATDSFLNAGVEAFDNLSFSSSPTVQGIDFIELEILMSTPTCLVVWSTTQVGYLTVDDPRSGVEVLREVEEGWRFMSAWKFREDLWEGDCDAQLQQ